MIIEELRERLKSLVTMPLLQRPTPLNELPRLSDKLGGVRLLMKREDLSGLALGGNKTRELDYFIGDALKAGANVFVAGGGVAQSNHAVQCAAAARRAGMLPVLVLYRFRDEAIQGNLLLNHLLGADIHFVDSQNLDAAMNQRLALGQKMEEAAEEYRAKGFRPYVLPSSFHPLGVIGYVDCAVELIEQLYERDLTVDHVYLTSAGATQVGLVLGSKLLGSPFSITGIAYTSTTTGLLSRMVALGNQAAEHLGVNIQLMESDIDEGCANKDTD